MLVNTVSELEILVEHGPQGERDRLHGYLVSRSCFAESILTLSIMYDVGGVSFESLNREETEGVSRSSKQMPPRYF